MYRLCGRCGGSGYATTEPSPVNVPEVVACPHCRGGVVIDERLRVLLAAREPSTHGPRRQRRPMWWRDVS
jgi:hypothetical protein